MNNVRIWGDFNFKGLVKLKPLCYYKRFENPVRLSFTAADTLSWVNSDKEKAAGAGLEMTAGRERGFAFRLTYSLQKPDENRNFIPNSYGCCRFSYRNLVFNNNLDYTIEIHGRYWGEREGDITGSHVSLGDDNVWGVRFIFKIGDFTLFWGNENIFGKEYEIIPGYNMIHREEVWGVNWIFWD